jgi:flagellar biosynthesis/type III secretory pathway M-ring protein FliF/YscJ
MTLAAVDVYLRTLLRKPWALGVAVVVGIAGLIGVACVIMRPPDIALFAVALDSAQLTEVDARLAAWGVNHAVLSDNISVSARERNDILLRLAMVGLPHAHLADSNETLEKLNALTPDSVFQAQARAGNAADLALALRGIDGVLDAGVVIAPAVHAPFSDEPDTGATAAVRLTLRSGTVLTGAAIDGIRSFIAGGVPGLTRERVTLLDDRGVALRSEAVAVSSHDDGSTIRASLQSAFDQAFGAGVTIIRVHVRYDMLQRSEHEIRRLPLGGPALREDANIEHLHSKEKNYDHEQHELERGSVLQEAVTQTPPGRPVAITVAVLVDAAHHLDTERLRSVAIASAGLDVLHGDQVDVESVPFALPPHIRANPATVLYHYTGILAALFFLAGGMVAGTRFAPHCLRLVRSAQVACTRGRRVRELAAPAGLFQPVHVHRALQREPAYTAAAVLGRLPAATAAGVLELYSSEERTAIVQRMMRQPSVYLGEWERVLRSNGH